MLRKFNNLKLRKKFYIVCLITSLVPTLLLGIFSYRQLQLQLVQRERLFLHDAITQEYFSISSQLTTYETISEYVVWNKDILSILNAKYQYNSQMYRAYTSTLEPVLSTTKHLASGINDILIYTNLEIYPRTGTLQPLSEIEDCAWYQEVSVSTKPLWIYSQEENKLFMIQRFLDIPTNIEAFVQLTIDSDVLFSRLKTIFDNSYGILVLDTDGNTIMDFNTADIQLPASIDVFSHSDFVTESITGTSTGWSFYIYRPFHIIDESTKPTLLIILLVLILCVFFATIVSYWLSSSLVRPIEDLAEKINLVSQGHYHICNDYPFSDEIGQLMETFTQLTQKIDYLINEKMRGEIIRQKLKFQALQAQINPHFLYNTLSLINSHAIIAGYPDIGLPARYLSTFYRTSLNKGKSLTFVKDELANIQAYINIQLFMHADSFDVSYHIDENIYGYSMPNLMLQPLVENAILHGIDNLENTRRGRLDVTAKSDGDNLVFVICDNGIGIPENTLKTLLDKPSGNYGINNVHSRAQLIYGGQFGLKFDSQLGSETKVTLTIPQTASPELLDQSDAILPDKF